MESIVEIAELNFGYSKKAPLFRNLTLSLAPGHIYGLFGKNGSGKTSLLKQITGLLFPHQGSCTLFGQPAGLQLPSVFRNVFVIPEDVVLPAINVKEFRDIHAPFYPDFDSGSFEKHLNEFGLKQSDHLHKISYGQKKKALIAFALATRVQLLLMDEPTNGLDIPSKSQFRKILAASSNEEQTILISTHQVRDLASLIDQVLILDEGRIVFNQSLETISKHLAFEKDSDRSSESPIYAEEQFGGQKVIRAYSNQATEIDLELLFNGVLNAPDSINQAFKQE